MTKPQRFQDLFYSLLAEKLHILHGSKYYSSEERERCIPGIIDRAVLEAYEQLEKEEKKDFCTFHNTPASQHPSQSPVCQWSQPKEEEKQECECDPVICTCGKRTAKRQPPEPKRGLLYKGKDIETYSKEELIDICHHMMRMIKDAETRADMYLKLF